MVAAIVIVVVVVKVLVWDAAIINVGVVDGVLVIDVDIIAVLIVLNFGFPASYFVDVQSGVDVKLFMDMSAGAMLGLLPGIGTEVFAGVNANTFAVVIADVEFPMSATLEAFSL